MKYLLALLILSFSFAVHAEGANTVPMDEGSHAKWMKHKMLTDAAAEWEKKRDAEWAKHVAEVKEQERKQKK